MRAPHGLSDLQVPGVLGLAVLFWVAGFDVIYACQDADFDRQAIHSEAGPKTLAQLLQGAVNHLPHHVRFIAEKRQALGA